MKLREHFYENLKQHYSSRKYKEMLNLICTDRCLKTFREDDLTRSEMNCMMACYNKSFRYLAFSNKVYTILRGGEEVEKYMNNEEEKEDLSNIAKKV